MMSPKQKSWDEARALRQLGGDSALLRELRCLFVEEEAPQQLRRLRAAMVERNAVEIAHAAHAIKGMAAQFCAGMTRDLAAWLESEARRGELTEADAVARELMAAVKNLCVELSG